MPDDRRRRRALECRINQYDVPDSLLQGDPRHAVAKSRPLHSGGQVRGTQHILVRPAPSVIQQIPVSPVNPVRSRKGRGYRVRGMAIDKSRRAVGKASAQRMPGRRLGRLRCRPGRRPDKPRFGCPRYANRQIQRGMQLAALPARDDRQSRFQPPIGSAIEPVLPGQRVISKTRCGRPTVRFGDAPPKRLHSAKTTRVDHLVCCARAVIGVMGVFDSLCRF